MKTIATHLRSVTVAPADEEPTAAQLDAIEVELPLILAEVDLLDAQITALDRVPNEVDARRLRRARRRVLAERRDLATRTAAQSGGAA
ncbi:DUF6284 family protein [Streptomyces sp. NPDC059740]|uniref:DUF6284 family protein n=1 Tax=Streptomyces sp. NPDC059740 TaxID=3346926 RepID=UPI00365F668C